MASKEGLKRIFREVLLSPSGFTGLLIILSVLFLSIGALFYVPFDIVKEWNNPTFWQRYPRLAAPSWLSFFMGRNLPQSIILGDESFDKHEYDIESIGLKYILLSAHFEYIYDDFPSEISAFINARYFENRPLATMKFIRPDGEEVILFHGVLNQANTTLYLSVNEDVKTRIVDFMKMVGANIPRNIYPEVVLFAVKGENMGDASKATILKGHYRIRLEITVTEPHADATAEVIIYGKVFGLAGTDSKRRDLMIGLIWGAPLALAFGLSAAIITSMVQSIMGALSAWYGGWVDETIQRITDIYMIMPFLPILITVSVVYKIDIWTLLSIVIILSILGGLTKTARSMTLQVMTEQYIEAAMSYGASRKRILFLYIMPRLMPYIVANIVLSVPAFVFLEAAMSILGLGDPRVPTWGKIIGDAYEGGAAIHGFWWWILLPSLLIILTAAAFAFLGYALDKVVNPRLRER